MKTKVIAISAISAGIVAILLTLGSIISYADIFVVILSSIVVILPIYLKSYKGAFLAYLAGGVIALITSAQFLGLSLALPAYAGFFGIYPIIRLLLQDKNVKKWVIYLIGAIWCVGAFYGIYYYCAGIIGLSFAGVPQFVIDYILLLIPPFALVFYVVYDRFILVGKNFLDRYLSKIIK